MGTTIDMSEWVVTAEKVDELIRRIVLAANPLQIIVFGSRARGDHRPESDLDLAVILDGEQETAHKRVPYTLLEGLHMSVDLVPVSKTKYDLHRPWINSVFQDVDREGVILYDREHPERACPDALHSGRGRSVDLAISAA